MPRPIDYIATAESYGFRIDTREDFEKTCALGGLKERADLYPGTHVLWDPEGDGDDFMLVGDGREALALSWFECDFANYGQAHQKITYAA